MKTLVGIVATAIALYLWGFLFWGLGDIPYSGWKQTADDAATQQMIREVFPESGTYYVPGFDHEPEERAWLFEQGPVGFVHIDLDGRPEMDPMIMGTGFVLNIVIVALMAAFFKVARAKEFRDFVRLSLIGGAVAVVTIHGGDMVWWQTPVEWKTWPLIYDFTAWLLVGHLLGFFMKSSEPT